MTTPIATTSPTAAPTADFVTVMTHRSLIMTKRVKPNPAGGIPLIEGAEDGKHFDAREYPANDLPGLVAVLRGPAPDPHSFIVWGKLIDGPEGENILRRSSFRRQTNERPTLKETEHRWASLGSRRRTIGRRHRP
jgi:hypothetical protein